MGNAREHPHCRRALNSSRRAGAALADVDFTVPPLSQVGRKTTPDAAHPGLGRKAQQSRLAAVGDRPYRFAQYTRARAIAACPPWYSPRSVSATSPPGRAWWPAPYHGHDCEATFALGIAGREFQENWAHGLTLLAKRSLKPLTDQMLVGYCRPEQSAFHT
jgi:hypothetical protein